MKKIIQISLVILFAGSLSQLFAQKSTGPEHRFGISGGYSHAPGWATGYRIDYEPQTSFVGSQQDRLWHFLRSGIHMSMNYRLQWKQNVGFAASVGFLRYKKKYSAFFDNPPAQGWDSRFQIFGTNFPDILEHTGRENFRISPYSRNPKMSNLFVHLGPVFGHEISISERQKLELYLNPYVGVVHRGTEKIYLEYQYAKMAFGHMNIFHRGVRGINQAKRTSLIGGVAAELSYRIGQIGIGIQGNILNSRPYTEQYEFDVDVHNNLTDSMEDALIKSEFANQLRYMNVGISLSYYLSKS